MSPSGEERRRGEGRWEQKGSRKEGWLREVVPSHSCSAALPHPRISASGEDGDTAACEAELGCTQEASTITESETGEERGTGQEEKTGEVTDGGGQEGEVGGDETMEAQLLFPCRVALDREAMEEDNAAGEAEFCCTQGVFFTPLTSDTAELEEGREGREVMGVRMRIVR